MKLSTKKHVVTKGKQRGTVRNNPTLAKHNVGNWINTQTTVLDPIYKEVPTGRKKIKMGNYSAVIGPDNKITKIGKDDFDLFDDDDDSKGFSVTNETKEVVSGYDRLRRPRWVHRITGTTIKIVPAMIRDRWNIYVKDANELVWTKIGSHPLFKSAYDLTVDYMKRRP
jgi:hypothetical protein